MWLKGLESVVIVGSENTFAPMLFTLLNASGKSSSHLSTCSLPVWRVIASSGEQQNITVQYCVFQIGSRISARINRVMTDKSRGRSKKPASRSISSHSSFQAQSSENSFQWIKLVDQLVQKVPSYQDWTEARNDLGLRTLEEDYGVIASLCGTERASGQYASGAKGHASKIRLRQLINNFECLLLASECCVLESTGTSVKEVNHIMQLIMPDVGPHQLARCRKGARWVNGAINDLAWAGWGVRATEIFLLCMFLLRTNL